MCIKVDSTVQVTLNKKQLGIGYKIIERLVNQSSYPKKTILNAPMNPFMFQKGKWMQCDPVFKGRDPIENHGFHIYLDESDAMRTMRMLGMGGTWMAGMKFDKYEVWQVYFKNVKHTGFAVNVTGDIEPLPCVVTEYILLKRKMQ